MDAGVALEVARQGGATDVFAVETVQPVFGPQLELAVIGGEQQHAVARQQSRSAANEHRVVALETQSTTAYVRNAVVRALTPGAPVRDGIVEETFPIEALSDPHVWYDCTSDEEYQRRLARMMDSVNAFLDMGPLVSVPMSEYFLG